MAGGCLLSDILIFGYVERSGVGVWAYGFGSEPPNVHSEYTQRRRTARPCEYHTALGRSRLGTSVPGTGYCAVFHGVPRTSVNELSSCVLSWCAHYLQQPVTILSFLWCTQCLQEHFIILCSLMMYPVPLTTGFHTVSFYDAYVHSVRK